MKQDVSGWQVLLSDQLIKDRTESGHWPNRTLFNYAQDIVSRAPDGALFIEHDRKISAGEAFHAAQALAGAFANNGLNPGDVISFQLPNWYEAAIIYLAAAMRGLVVNPIVPIFRDSEVRFMLRDSRSRMIFIPQKFRSINYVDMMQRLRPDLPDLEHVVILRGDPGPFTAWNDFMEKAGATPPLPVVDPNAVKIIMYTSGTTGRPKGVLHSHNTMLAEITSYQEYWKMGAEDIIFMPSTVSHITGCLMALELPWVCNSPVVLMDVWDANKAIDLIVAHQATFTCAATPFLQELLSAARERGENLVSLKRFICGGASVPPELVRQASKWFGSCVVCRCYGASEVPSVTIGVRARSEIDQAAETDGFIGDSEVRICDPITGAILDGGQEGEILVRCPEQFLGYARPEDNEDAFDDDGFFKTGDLGRLTQQNCLVITGRKKDLIIRGGENLSPKEIEDALFLHPAISEVAVVGMPHPRLGEAVACFVVPAAGQIIDQPEVSRFLTEAGLARQKIPERVELVDHLPKNAVGKVLKVELRDRMRAIAET